MRVFASTPHARGIARLVGYCFVALLVLSAAVARAGYESLADRQLRAGESLDSLNALFGAPRTVVFNGAAVSISEGLVHETPGQVLDRYESLCESSTQLTAEAMSDIAATMRSGPAPAPSATKLDLGVVRKDGVGVGALTCFAGERPFSLRDLPARLKAFAASSDLSAFGKFRYVYAKAVRGATSVRTVWSDGPMNLDTMFPAEGDAAGFDSPVVPRPPGSRRVFSFAPAQVVDTVHVYEARAPEETLRAFYDREMLTRGWKAVSRDGKATVVYGKSDGSLVYCTFGSKAALSTVTATALGADSTRPFAPIRP
jgi:hypothetical protein